MVEKPGEFLPEFFLSSESEDNGSDKENEREAVELSTSATIPTSTTETIIRPLAASRPANPPAASGVSSTPHASTSGNTPDAPDSRTSGNTPSSSATSASGRRKRTDTPKENFRKRSYRKEEWIRVKAKKHLNRGEAHMTTERKWKEARKMKAPCDLKCRMCEKRRDITHEIRQREFDTYWKLGEKRAQWDFLTRRVTLHEPKKVTALPGQERSHNRKYYFECGGKRTVCKKMFFATYGISPSVMSTALQKVERGGNVTPDRRGTHDNRPNQISSSIKDSVREHINSLPRVHSHYTRARTKREYLEHYLSITRLHKMYRVWATERNMGRMASRRQYRTIFNSEYNIGFFKPKKDLCALCQKWKTASREERIQMVGDYRVHLENYKFVKKVKNEEKEMLIKQREEGKEEVCMACFDLQKVLQCPRSQVGSFFYKNKVSIFNFTIFNITRLQGFCCLWNQTEAKRGSNEIATNVFDFTQHMSEQGFKKMSFYSDNCGGQNKNRNIFCSYLLAAKKFGVDIVHRFLEAGHTQNEADSMHARIEIEAGTREIFSEAEWKELILSAKQEGHSYNIVDVKNEYVHDFNDAVRAQNWKRAVDGRIVKWSKVREVSVEQTGLVHVRYDLRTEERLTLNPNSANGAPILDLEAYEIPRAYAARIPLKENKARDIRELCRKGDIPSKYHDYFQAILDVGAAPVETTPSCPDASCGDEVVGQAALVSDEDASCSEDDELSDQNE